MRALKVEDVASVLRNSKGARVDEDVPAKFKVGDNVITRNINTLGHTRLPRYSRARRGVVACDHGVFIFPDSHAMGPDRKPQHLYSVRFTARELWGDQASERDSVHLDMWDDYLESA
jgi:hypothetical protein